LLQIITDFWFDGAPALDAFKRAVKKLLLVLIWSEMNV